MEDGVEYSALAVEATPERQRQLVQRYNTPDQSTNNKLNKVGFITRREERPSQRVPRKVCRKRAEVRLAGEPLVFFDMAQLKELTALAESGCALGAMLVRHYESYCDSGGSNRVAQTCSVPGFVVSKTL
jgi:hypothetical protein